MLTKTLKLMSTDDNTMDIYNHACMALYANSYQPLSVTMQHQYIAIVHGYSTQQ